MKKTLTILLLTLLPLITFAQSAPYKDAFEKFRANYNADNFKGIFDDFSETMQSALPLENTNLFFVGLKFQVGNIQEGHFLAPEAEGTVVVKTTFERATLAVHLSLDEADKISGLMIQPHTEPKSRNLTNRLTDYPKAIGHAIYSHAQEMPNKTQLSIAVLQQGTATYYGATIENDTLHAIQNQHRVFEIGSISKVFTSTVLAALVVDGDLKLTDTINGYYPFPFRNNQPIQLVHLANHTAGLPRLPGNLDLTNLENPYKSYDQAALQAYLSQHMEISDNTAQQYEYSNLSAGLLGHTLALSQQQTFSTLLQKYIFQQYGMTRTFTQFGAAGDDLVIGLDELGTAVSNWEFDVLLGAGGILSSTEDLVKFAQAQFNPENQILALTRKPTFDIDAEMRIGLGWHILKSSDDSNLYWHNGGTGGYSSSMVLHVDQQHGIIILSNVGGASNAIDKLCFDLLEQIGN